MDFGAAVMIIVAVLGGASMICFALDSINQTLKQIRDTQFRFGASEELELVGSSEEIDSSEENKVE